jgi:2-dehydropantoate 2-reductase
LENQHTIYIVGGGAIGRALAVVLKNANRNVVILRASTAVEAHQEIITLVLPDEREIQATIEVASPDYYQELDGIVVLTNKSYGNKHISTVLRNKTGNSPIVILQNGLGVEEIFIQDNYTEIYRCVLFATSQLSETNKVNFKPVSASAIGIVKGNSQALAGIIDNLNTEIFPFKAEENIQKIIWKKTIINCVFNSVCPLIEADNGIFYRDANVLNLALRIIDECVEIANAYHIGLSQSEILESLLMISRLSDGQLISSYQDILNNRPTEIETLNFAIAKMAETVDKVHLVKETRLLGELIKLKSELNRNL